MTLTCLSFPSKFHTLIQTQARELSVLRQHLREGRGVCHILSQHLGDTTKAFEELLRANDIDYYMGQSFRDQLAQSSTLAQKVSKKISTCESDFLGTIHAYSKTDKCTCALRTLFRNCVLNTTNIAFNVRFAQLQLGSRTKVRKPLCHMNL